VILVCGEALIDLFVGVPGGPEMSTHAVAGGSPFNVAVGLARLGVRTAFLSGISRDHFGALLLLPLLRKDYEKVEDAENEHERQQCPDKTAATGGILKK